MADRDQMVARQKALAAFGEFALRSDDLAEVLHEACRIVGDALGTDLAKVLEINHDRHDLLVKAGVGWRPGIVGHKRLPLGEHSSETYAIELGQPVITQDIAKEKRFAFPEFMMEHGIKALVNVPIFLPGGKPYGLLQVDAREPSAFGDEDIAFLRTYTTIIGPVIDRLHKAHSLEQALRTNERLLQELQHRVKNHVAIIASLVGLRARQVASEEARRELAAVGERIETLRLLNEQLYIAGTADRLRLRPFLMQLVENLCQLHRDHAGPVRLDLAIEEVELDPDTAMPLGLILNEFVTNSLKYAFEGGGGVIGVKVERQEGGSMLRLRLSDDGRGLPSEERAVKPGSGTGMKLIEGLARQIGAKPIWSPGDPGTVLRLEFAPDR
jgi:two-component sensor histidine kinase